MKASTHPAQFAVDDAPAESLVVVGAGEVGLTLAGLLASAGRGVKVSSRRSVEELRGDGHADLLDQPGVDVVPIDGAAEGADIVVLAVPFVAAAATLGRLGDLDGVIVVDTTNYNRRRDGRAVDPGPNGTTPVLAAAFPTARWVKSFNMLWAGWLRTDARPMGQPDRVVFLAGDDGSAKGVVTGLIWDAGFVPFDTGTHHDAAERQLEGTPAWNQRLTYEQAARLFPEAPGAEAGHLAKGVKR